MIDLQRLKQQFPQLSYMRTYGSVIQSGISFVALLHGVVKAAI